VIINYILWSDYKESKQNMMSQLFDIRAPQPSIKVN